MIEAIPGAPPADVERPAMRSARPKLLLAAPWLLPCAIAQAAQGLAAPTAAEVWPRWQARIAVQEAALQRSAIYLDGYLSLPGLRLPEAGGGLRATGGLVPSPRSAGHGLRLGPHVPVDTVPYFGLGWTQLWAKSRWSLTADLGVVAENPGGVLPLGRALLGQAGRADAAWRELRLSPVLQLGLSYAF